MTLMEYIENYYEGNQAAFARAQGTSPQQVSVWLKKGFIVKHGVLYSPRRVLKH